MTYNKCFPNVSFIFLPSWPLHLSIYLLPLMDWPPWEKLLGVAQSPQDAKAAFIHSLKKYLLSACCVPGSIPGIGELSTVNTIEKELAF